MRHYFLLFLVKRYISVKPSSVPAAGPWEKAASRLVTPNLYHPEDGVGLLTFDYRMDSWLGSSNATLK